MQYAYDCHIGKKRKVNQDRAIVIKNEYDQYLAIVCDGMGGHVAGELASSMCIDSMCQSFFNHGLFKDTADATYFLSDACKTANFLVYEDAMSHPEHRGMGTTMVCMLVLKKQLVISHVGDSRLYFDDGSQLIQMTTDHTYVNMLVETGSITKEEAKTHPKRNILLKALGVFDQLTMPIQIRDFKEGTYVLCSDGLYNLVSEETIKTILDQPKELNEKVMELIDLANAHGGTDNISVILVDNKGGESDGSHS